MILHSQDKPFKCTYCEEHFKSRFARLKHQEKFHLGKQIPSSRSSGRAALGDHADEEEEESESEELSCGSEGAVPGDEEVCLFVYCFGGRCVRGPQRHLLTVGSWTALGVARLPLLCVGKNSFFRECDAVDSVSLELSVVLDEFSPRCLWARWRLVVLLAVREGQSPW